MWGATYEDLKKQLADFISIHAPMWGATFYFLAIKFVILFQSTHPCGVRQSEHVLCVVIRIFQSTHPCGVRHRQSITGIKYDYFNPRTHVGCDGSNPAVPI